MESFGAHQPIFSMQMHYIDFLLQPQSQEMSEDTSSQPQIQIQKQYSSLELSSSYQHAWLVSRAFNC